MKTGVSSFTKRAAVVLLALMLIFLSLAFASAAVSVQNARSAIAEIGEVSYEPETRERIDAAQNAWQALDVNLGLTERVNNSDVLTQAKVEYVRLAIRELYLAEQADGENLDTALITAAREAFDAYFTPDDAGLISNYTDLTDAEARYSSGTADAPALVEEEKEEDIELC